MIICPNCDHANPDGATQCEACYTPLPETLACPSCGASIQTDATFCGQCGYNLQPVSVGAVSEEEMTQNQTVAPPIFSDLPDPDPDPDLWEVETPVVPPSPPPKVTPTIAPTQLQIQVASLLHVQTQTPLELPTDLTVIHIGKPNDQIPPDVDVSGFPSSEVVSRIHADIRVEGDIYYLEDVGSSNGTYVNHTPLPKGNRHRLRSGDRISLGKGDLVTFIFQMS